MIEWSEEAWQENPGFLGSAALAPCPGEPSAEESLRRQSAGTTVSRFFRHSELPTASAGVSRDELLETGHALGKLVELHLHAEPAYRKLAYELSSVRTERRAPLEKSR
jgi:hypothetical protein